MKNNNIICDYVKVIGSSHIAKNIPCQDFSISEIYNDHVILINCDGAGSAKKAEIGSQSFAELFLIELKKIADNLKNNPPGEWIIDEIIISISNVRKQIRNRFKTNSLSDYHTTLVAIISGENGGFICHIGDGYGLAITDKDFFISEPENGEYANETFFATESNWIKHLRITPFGGAIKFLGVMSDGAGSLFESSGKFNQVNLCVFINDLINVKSHKEVLNDFLSNDIAVKKSNDDKSISFYINKISDFNSLFKINKFDNIYNDVPSDNSDKDDHNNEDELILKSKSTYISYIKIFLLIISCTIILLITSIAIDNFLGLKIFNKLIHLKDKNSNTNQNKVGKIEPQNCNTENNSEPNSTCDVTNENKTNSATQNNNAEVYESPKNNTIPENPKATTPQVDSK